MVLLDAITGIWILAQYAFEVCLVMLTLATCSVV